LHNSRNHKLRVANRAKNQTQRRPVDAHFKGFAPYGKVNITLPTGESRTAQIPMEDVKEAMRSYDPFQ
jgi:hypothetical protein